MLVPAIGFLAMSVFAGLTYAMTADRSLLMLAAGPYTVALPLGASAVAIARTHVLPMWMAWFAAFVARGRNQRCPAGSQCLFTRSPAVSGDAR
ncbi:MAG: hypothetical protein ACRDOO_18415 [Actinomadura sp.]